MAADLLEEVRAALGAALGDTLVETMGAVLPGDGAARVVEVGPGQTRRRSELRFLGLEGDRRPRWVLKVPQSASRQHDLAPPLPAAEQVRALRRLGAHFAATGGDTFVPRVLADLSSAGGYVMDFVPGTPLTAHLRLGALRDADDVLRGTAAAARVLRELHRLEPGPVVERDLAQLHREAVDGAEQVLRAAGLPVRDTWLRLVAARPVPARTLAREVLLHGDFAPENIVLAERGVCCLDPDLVTRDRAEHDVVRFLLMLADAPLFVVLGQLSSARLLRHHATRVFLATYYADSPADPALRPLMLAALASRWATRHGDVAARRPPLAALRRVLLARHFARLLDEVASPGWPDTLA